MESLPNMETFMKVYEKEITSDIHEKIAWNLCGMDRIVIDSNILKIMGTETAVIISLMIEAKQIAEDTYGNSGYDHYYLHPAERKLDEIDKYHEDKQGNIWFTYPLRKMQERTRFPLKKIREIIKFLQSINFIKIEKEKRFKKSVTWYYIPTASCTSMLYYCAWKAGDILPWKK